MSTKTDALQTRETNTALARPDFIPQSQAGTEHITKDDIQLPRLALAQGLTPQVSEGKEGFSVGVLFNSVTEEVIGRGPIDFYIVRADKPRFIEFFPRESGGGVKDMSVPANDPRTQFGRGPNGETIKPAATKFYDFLIVLADRLASDPMNSLIGLSFKSSGLKTARTLNNLVKFRNAPLFAGKYRLSTTTEKNAKGTYAIYKVENAGFVQDKATYDVLEGLFSTLADKTVTIDREVGADDVEDATFDPSKFGGDNA
jgi:hypothetical protein